MIERRGPCPPVWTAAVHVAHKPAKGKAGGDNVNDYNYYYDDSDDNDN